MASRGVSIELVGVDTVIESLVGVNVDAARAQKSAMRTAANAVRTGVVRRFAKKTGVIAKVWRKRVNHYPYKSRRGLSVRKVWVGLKRKPKAGEHASVARALRAKHADAFWATMTKTTGHRGLFRRRKNTIPYGPDARAHPRERQALPIDELSVDVSDIADAVLIEQGKKVMRGKYVEVLERDFKRRVAKRLKKNLQRKLGA